MLQSGKKYKESNIEMADGPEETPGTTETVTAPTETLGMTEVMCLLMDDRRVRERELREQMEMLRSLVEVGTRRSSTHREWRNELE